MPCAHAWYEDSVRGYFQKDLYNCLNNSFHVKRLIVGLVDSIFENMETWVSVAQNVITRM